jgi:GntR family transcriptional regulator, transcriptional repressor for pyruvate dehydrogenase complex
MSVESRNSTAFADPRAFAEADLGALAAGTRTKSEADGQAIYQTLRGLIVEGGMSPGSRLPTERALAERFLAARNTVRKTMNRLVHEGLVVRHVGRGTFVTDAPAQPEKAAKEAEFGLSELLEARLLFEPGMAELVVERASDEDLVALSNHLGSLRRAETWQEFKEAKYALHLAIARASKNRFLVQMFECIVASRRGAAWDRPGGHRLPVSAVLEHAISDNAAIVDALRSRDGAAARDLIRANLTRTLLSVGDG